MGDFTAADVNADLDMLMDGFSTEGRSIPSMSKLLKVSFFVPLFSLFSSFLATVIVYLSGFEPLLELRAFIDFFINDGWVVLAPALVVGLFFSLMIYNNLIVYFTIPENVRNKSKILIHLRKLVFKVLCTFLILMVLSALFSGSIGMLAFAPPVLQFVLLFVVNMVVGMEINRLGAGVMLEKLAGVIKKI